MARIALRWVVVALVAASFFLAATIALSRLRLQHEAARAVELQVPVDSIAVPLDARGVGVQTIAPAELSLKLDPYPPRAGDPTTLTLVALDRNARTLLIITPTLSVAALTQVDGVEHPMLRQDNGAYAFTGLLFPTPGRWRLRVSIDFGVDAPYRMLALVEAQ